MRIELILAEPQSAVLPLNEPQHINWWVTWDSNPDYIGFEPTSSTDWDSNP